MKIIGYIFGILGLIVLVYNAYLYLSGSDIQTMSTISALLLCLIGGVMIFKRKKRKK